MVLTPGTRLHAYEITGQIGAGGMGEVYRAHDARLARDVAIKVLPSSVSADPAALARFEREARSIGALNHPNIVNVFDTGSERPSAGSGQAAIAFVVMELLEGETLRTRLQGSAAHTAMRGTTPRPSSGATPQGGLPRKKALEIAQQIAQGLAAAHARGIVHRDLKPENVFLTADGRVKILDFGLARAVPEAVSQASDAETHVSPNVAADSVPGLVLGTVGYMAPEQVHGHVVDHRADIFAFGAVLYEMLTGERAFEGDSPIETMSAILKADPLERPAAGVAISGPLEPLVRHCLEKQPDERFQSARDLAFQLQAIAGGIMPTTAAERAIGEKGRGARRWTAGVGAALVLTVGIGIGYFARGEPREETITFAVPMPPGVRVAPFLSPARSGGLAVSRDGRRIAFVAGAASSPSHIFVHSIDTPRAHAIPGTEGGSFPTWSPDGQRVAFMQGRNLKQVAIDGGSLQVIADVGDPRSAPSWGDDDTLLYHWAYRQPLMRVAASGGTPSVVLPLVREISWFSPLWLPDGRRFLVVRFPYEDAVAEGAGIYVGSIDSQETRLLIAGRIAEVAVADRELYYRRGAELVVQPFDAANAKLAGEPRVLSDHVSMIAARGPTLVYFDPPGGLSLGHRLALFSRKGELLSYVGNPGSMCDPKLSADGRHVAVARADDESGLFSIWAYDLARNIDTRVTNGSIVSPAWSRDSRYIFAATEGRLLRFEPGAGREPHVLRQLPAFANLVDLSPDGHEAILMLVTEKKGVRLVAVALEGSADPRTLDSWQNAAQKAAFSPDGKWVALTSNDDAVRRLYVQPYPGPGRRIPVTSSVASYPRWRGDGREVYFVGSGDATSAPVMAVPVAWTANGPDFGAPQLLFRIPRPVLGNLGIDVTADGQKFVAIVADEPDASPLTVRMRIAH